jgi:glutathione S-transferase
MSATANTAAFTLYTFAMSHYSEKIRWTLDVAKVPYQEQCLSPVFHMSRALSLGKRGQTTLPVLQTPEVSIQDSPRILDWLSARHLIDVLLPAAQIDEARAIEQRFNAIGKDVARLLYARSFGKADAHIVKLWTDHASPAQALFIKLGYPLIRWGFRQKLRINEKSAQRAEQRIEAEVRWLDERLKDGRTFLVGDRFSVHGLWSRHPQAKRAESKLEHSSSGTPQGDIHAHLGTQGPVATRSARGRSHPFAGPFGQDAIGRPG